ncbi:MAG: hypothetical protein IBX55_00725 [Methyloprofundus sp.]|nr:hypothetical protein [Methyloprofundus sp.]
MSAEDIILNSIKEALSSYSQDFSIKLEEQDEDEYLAVIRYQFGISNPVHDFHFSCRYNSNNQECEIDASNEGDWWVIDEKNMFTLFFFIQVDRIDYLKEKRV